MNYIHYFFLILLSYLYGSIPFGLIIGKVWKGIDVRTLGSKNIGATNVLRTLGPGPAAFTFLGDVSKGALAVLIGRRFGSDAISLLCGLSAIAGHNWSIFLKFSGGRGVATTIGVFIVLLPLETLCALGVWAIVVLLTRYVSLGSILAISTFPLQALIFHRSISVIIFSFGIAFMGIYKHRANISRLLSGTEFKIGQRVGIDGTLISDEEPKRSLK